MFYRIRAIAIGKYVRSLHSKAQNEGLHGFIVRFEHFFIDTLSHLLVAWRCSFDSFEVPQKGCDRINCL